jgi:hypothetical protein
MNSSPKYALPTGLGSHLGLVAGWHGGPYGKVRMALLKNISGGQTEVDRTALDAALAVGFACGGWCPEGRNAEDGVISEKYPVVVLDGTGYRERTWRNVVDSDGTLILFNREITGGTKLTRGFCVMDRKPFLAVDAGRVSVAEAVIQVMGFVAEKKIAVLNVAGPRASGWSDGYQFALAVVGGVIGLVRKGG